MAKSSLLEQNCLDYVETHQERILLFLQKLIQLPTITPQYHQTAQGDAYRNLQDVVSDLLSEMGVDSIDIWEQDAAELDEFPGSGISPGRDLGNMPILAATIKGYGGGKSLILNGHYDVVPVGDQDLWSSDPFSGEIRDRKVFGRGACDMKGGIAAMLFALKFLDEQGIQLNGDVIVQMVPDEEMSCMGTLACCQRGYQADAALIPEPTDMRIMIAMRGSRYGEIVVRGRAGHAEMPQQDWQEGGGVNAISKAKIVLQAIDELNKLWESDPNKQHPLLPPDVVVPVGIRGGGDWSVTLADAVHIQFGMIVQPSSQDVFEALEQFLLDRTGADSWLRAKPPEVKYEKSYHYGAEISEDEPVVELAKGILDDLGFSPEVCGYGSLTDAIHLINFSKIPTISIGPTLQQAHMVDEYIEIDQLVDLTKMITLLLIRWCGVGYGS